MVDTAEEFYRIQKLPPYVFAVLNEKCAHARAEKIDVIDLGMGNPDGETPLPVVQKSLQFPATPRLKGFGALPDFARLLSSR